MTYCNRCESVFDDVEVICHAYTEDDGYERRELQCPSCGSDDIVNAARCKHCGEYISEDDLISGICAYCYDEIISKIADIFKDSEYLEIENIEQLFNEALFYNDLEEKMKGNDNGR